MTSREALENIKHIDLHGRYPYPYYLKDDLEYKEAIETLEKLVERDTPKKPQYGFNQNGKPDYICPTCNFDVVFKERFCSHCGQRLDWSNE